MLINKEIYEKIKLLAPIALRKKIYRRSLEYIFYNSKKKEIVVTDGLLLRLTPIDLGDSDIFIDPSFFKKPFKTVSQIYNTFEFNHPCEADSEALGLIFPQYEKVIPSKEQENRSVISANTPLTINRDALVLLLSTFPKDSKLVFITTTQVGPIKIYTIDSKDDDGKFCGLIMPLKWGGVISKNYSTPNPIPKCPLCENTFVTNFMFGNKQHLYCNNKKCDFKFIIETDCKQFNLLDFIKIFNGLED